MSIRKMDIVGVGCVQGKETYEASTQLSLNLVIGDIHGIVVDCLLQFNIVLFLSRVEV